MPQIGQLVEIAHHLATFSFSQYQESDADAQGQRMAIESGYDPAAAAALFRRMKQHAGEASRTPATTPAGEVAQSVGGALESFFRSHPLSDERIRNVEAIAARAHSGLAGKAVYVGKQNLAERIPRSAREYPSEFRIYQ